MNKIIIDSNKISNYKDKDVSIKKNNIIFTKDGSYNLEIVNSNKIDLNIKVNKDINVSIYIYSINNDISTNVKYILDDNSKLLVYKFYNNSSNNISDYIYLNGYNSSVDYRLSSISKNEEDYNIIIYHNNIKAKSKISNKCIAMDNSKIVFNIDSIVEKGNIGVSMNQDTKVMCLGDAEAKIEPNMLIDEDDVEARHGSVVGKFNIDNIFYLMSRGITEEDAVRLMIKGFILSHLILDKNDEMKIINIIKDNFG